MRRWRLTAPLFLLTLVTLLPAARPALAAHECLPQPMFCGETRRGALDAAECLLDEETWVDFYTFGAPAGQEVTVTLTADRFTPSLILYDPIPDEVVEQNGAAGTLTVRHTLERGGLWRIGATAVEPRQTGLYEITLECAAPPPPAGGWLTSGQVPGFRFKVRITARESIAGAKASDCLEDSLCVSGAVPGRTEVILRVLGPRGNGFLWPVLVKLTTSQVEVWIEQQDTGEVRYYFLPGADPASSDLPGFFDREGFVP